MMADATAKPAAKDDTETPRERFVRLASRRVSTAQEDVSKIGLLAQKGSYEYESADVDKIEQALLGAVRTSIAALREGKVPKATGFSLE
jgi:hypothetical protein